MIKNVKIIFIDLDGTICNDISQIMPYTCEVIKKAIKSDICVVFCSGRANSDTIEMSKFAGASSIVISDNGSLVFDYDKNIKIFESNIEKVILSDIWKFSQKYNIGLALNSTYKRFKNENSNKKANMINSIDKLEDDVTQMVINVDNYSDIQCLKEYIEKKYEELECKNIWNNVRNNSFEMDICNKFNSKGNAISILLSKLNINKENSVCFGDQLNDLSMFENCNIKIAMKNGNEILKSNADFITNFTNNDEGVAKFINQFILGKNV